MHQWYHNLNIMYKNNVLSELFRNNLKKDYYMNYTRPFGFELDFSWF